MCIYRYIYIHIHTQIYSHIHQTSMHTYIQTHTYTQRSESGRRRSGHTFFGARYVPTQAPTLDSLGRGREDRLRDGVHMHTDSINAATACTVSAQLCANTAGSTPRAYDITHAPMSVSSLCEGDDDEAMGGMSGQDSSREPSVCQSEAESEGQASEAGESSEVCVCVYMYMCVYVYVCMCV